MAPGIQAIVPVSCPRVPIFIHTTHEVTLDMGSGRERSAATDSTERIPSFP